MVNLRDISVTQYIKVEALTAAELLKEFELFEPDAKSVMVADTAPQISIENLIKGKFYQDAIKLLAHALPKRLAVWWACLAARKAQTPETSEDNLQALIATEAWAKKPTEQNRLQCKTLAEATQFKTAASWAAMAAAWCAGSMANEGEPEIPPPAYLYAHAVSGCVSLAASTIDPEKTEDFYELFLAQGIDLACGGNGLIND